MLVNIVPWRISQLVALSGYHQRGSQGTEGKHPGHGAHALCGVLPEFQRAFRANHCRDLFRSSASRREEGSGNANDQTRASLSSFLSPLHPAN